MSLYYSHAGIDIHHGDCREILPTLPKHDLLLTDPPYGIGVSSRTFGAGRINGTGFKNARGSNFQPKAFTLSDWDDKPADDDLIALCVESAEQQCIWGGNYFALPPSMGWLVWDKRNDGTDFADCELAWTNRDKAIRQFRYRWNGMLQEFAGRFKEERLHPTMKPLPLMKWCLSLFPLAQTVLDPFCGSGTTGVACKALGLRCTMIDQHEPYCEIAAKRLNQEVFDFGA